MFYHSIPAGGLVGLGLENRWNIKEGLTKRQFLQLIRSIKIMTPREYILKLCQILITVFLYELLLLYKENQIFSPLGKRGRKEGGGMG